MPCNDDEVEEARVDQWLWAVRICKTRTAATDACRAGHVKVNGAPAKPATPVKVGDTVDAFIHDRPRVLQVERIITKRVGAPVAAECLIDDSPPPPTRDEAIAAILTRDPGTGRPTKRDRRKLDRFRTS